MREGHSRVEEAAHRAGPSGCLALLFVGVQRGAHQKKSHIDKLKILSYNIVEILS